MTKERFLTIRWNNLLTLALGIPTVIYMVYAYSTSLWTTRGGLIGLALIGVVYWLGIEAHTDMRFAWLRENTPDYSSVQQAFLHPLALIRKAYNLAFWIFLLPFFTIIDYSTGFVLFTVIIGIRLVLNLYTNNIYKPTLEQYEAFPFRIP
jgi:hypothetical protein